MAMHQLGGPAKEKMPARHNSPGTQPPKQNTGLADSIQEDECHREAKEEKVHGYHVACQTIHQGMCKCYEVFPSSDSAEHFPGVGWGGVGVGLSMLTKIPSSKGAWPAILNL